jgi:hypothetical protein
MVGPETVAPVAPRDYPEGVALSTVKRMAEPSSNTVAETTAQNALRMQCEEATRDQIVSALQRLTDEGGGHNFVILRADPSKNYLPPTHHVLRQRRYLL